MLSRRDDHENSNDSLHEKWLKPLLSHGFVNLSTVGGCRTATASPPRSMKFVPFIEAVVMGSIVPPTTPLWLCALLLVASCSGQGFTVVNAVASGTKESLVFPGLDRDAGWGIDVVTNKLSSCLVIIALVFYSIPLSLSLSLSLRMCIVISTYTFTWRYG